MYLYNYVYGSLHKDVSDKSLKKLNFSQRLIKLTLDDECACNLQILKMFTFLPKMMNGLYRNYN